MSFTAKPFHAHKQFQIISHHQRSNLIDDLAAVLDNQIVFLQRLRALDAPPATLRLAQSARAGIGLEVRRNHKIRWSESVKQSECK